jgi:hypothetical protein
MTRRISLIFGLAAIALTVAVPAAFGEGRLAGSQEHSDFWNYESNAKVADSSPGVAPQDLAKLFAGSGRRGLGTNYAEVVSPDTVGLLMAKNGVVDSSLVDALTANGGSVEVSRVTSGTEIEWTQVGIGLGIGILLVLGLGLATRIAHVRPFAH